MLDYQFDKIYISPEWPEKFKSKHAPMHDPVLAVLCTILAGSIIVALYSVHLQKRAVSKQNKAIRTMDENTEMQKQALELQKQGIELSKESNALLKEIVSVLKTKS